ncbi:hypothetical protein KC660_01310 [Candidatus Dojkabacteria bacterium]|uniref:B3/B4 tRNA-binding domain-containing protein n=1 Tax=Candidatus Dojkabacteria bacterium TaxID=2099670 RepID=A0A955L328_9BACT|nr:hypothetical protein [Candidatus Dojkabacteria bacterium]
MKTFSINSELFKIYQGLLVGYCLISNFNNSGEDEEVSSLLRSEESKVEAKFSNIEVNEYPSIAVWRDAYIRFGAKPKKYPSSIENLIKRNLKGNRLPHINKLVDIYNYISLKYLVPVGGEDLDKVEGDIQLTIAGEDEVPVKLLGENEERPPYPNEVIYKDGIGTTCRRWNWKEADRTKLTEDTSNAIVVIELLPPVDTSSLEQALNELRELITRSCGGEVRTGTLDESNQSVELV